MKKIFFLVFSFVFLLSACSANNSNFTSSNNVDSEITSENVSNFEYQFSEVQRDENYLEVRLPYQTILSPELCGRTLYMAVSVKDNPTGYRDAIQLVSYNLDTKQSELLFTSSYDEANIQQINCDGSWLVWTDVQAWGAACDLYVKNLETQEVVLLEHFTPQAASVIIPSLMDGVVYYIVEEGLNNDLIYGTLYAYDCESKSKSVIARLENIHLYNLAVRSAQGKVVWNETIDGKGFLFLYDTKTKKISRYATSHTYSHNTFYHNGIIMFIGTKDFFDTTKISTCYFYDTNTLEEYPAPVWGTVMDMVGNYMLIYREPNYYIYQKDGSEYKILDAHTDYNCNNRKISVSKDIITVQDNKGGDETVLNIHFLGNDN